MLTRDRPCHCEGASAGWSGGCRRGCQRAPCRQLQSNWRLKIQTLFRKVSDQAEPEQVQDLIVAKAAEFSGVDALVINAGSCFVTVFVDISPAEL